MTGQETNDDRIAALEADVARLREALCTAVVWIGQSASSPLAHSEVAMLIGIVNPTRNQGEAQR